MHRNYCIAYNITIPTTFFGNYKRYKYDDTISHSVRPRRIHGWTEIY